MAAAAGVWPWRRGRHLQLLMLASWLCSLRTVQPLGSMNSMAASYGENGQTLCSLRAEKANVVTCFGSDVASVYGAPPRLPLVGLTGEINQSLHRKKERNTKPSIRRGEALAAC